MSSILDALKKSEQERKLNNVPTLSDMPVPQEASRWPLYVIGVLSLVLAVAIGVLVSPWFSAQNKPEPAPQLVVSQDRQNDAVSETLQRANSGGPADDIVINVVSYSDQPQQSFVMLDGKMYRENDYVQAGLKVSEIKPNAVVLNLRGELITRSP